MKLILVLVAACLVASLLLFGGGDVSFARPARERSNGEADSLLIESESTEGLSDDVTFLFAIVNIRRKDHLGLSGKDYSFEADYLRQLTDIMDFMAPHKLRVMVQKQYHHIVQKHMRPGVDLQAIEVEDLTGFEYYDHIEAIRNSDWWVQKTPWLSSVPQGYSNLYNPLVMQKILWLHRLAKENPFRTKYFMWLDSGGICTPSLRHWDKEEFKDKVRYFLRGNRLLITAAPYAQSDEVHGCQRALMLKVTNGIHACFVTKGWIMGGTKLALDRIVPVYKSMLNRTLSMGCLGTEETIFTLLQYTHPHLISLYYNSERHDVPWSGGFCDFLSHNKYELPAEYPQEAFMREFLAQRAQHQP